MSQLVYHQLCLQQLVGWSERRRPVAEGVAALAVPEQIPQPLQCQVNELVCLEAGAVAMVKRRSRCELEKRAWTF